MARDADCMTFLVLSQSHPTSTRFPLENCHWQQETTLICEVPHHVSNSQVYEFLKAVTVSSPKNISAQQQGRTERGRFPILGLSQKVWGACDQQALFRENPN